MKIFLYVVTLILVHLCNGEGDDCPQEGVDILFHDIDSKGEVESWEDCGIFCQSTKGCKYWTWNKSNLMCYLKDNNSYSEHNDIAVSGDRNCP